MQVTTIPLAELDAHDEDRSEIRATLQRLQHKHFADGQATLQRQTTYGAAGKIAARRATPLFLCSLYFSLLLTGGADASAVGVSPTC